MEGFWIGREHFLVCELEEPRAHVVLLKDLDTSYPLPVTVLSVGSI